MIRLLVQRLGVGERIASRFLIACMIIGFASLVAVGIAAAWSTERNQEHTAWVDHTYEVEIAIDRAGILIEQAETARRGYLLTGQPAYLAAYARRAAGLPTALRRIARMTADNPRQQANIARLEHLTDALGAQRERTIALARAGRRAAAIELFGGETAARRMRGIRGQAQAMVDEERGLLAIRDASQRDSVRTFYLILLAAGALLLLIAVASLATVLRYTRELADSRDTLRDFADSLEEQVTERTADLLHANQEIQRFAYIVSHDLRSPLVNVMGFTAELETATAALAELVDRAEEAVPAIVTEEARTAARTDLPEAIGFIRTSTRKMDRLINAILKLSREGRRTIVPEPIELAAVIDAIAGSLRHMIDDRGATLAIEGALPAIVSDRLAIEQILSNLIENALKYLQPGRPGRIVVRGRRSGARVTCEIEDNGRGIAAADHQRVFDLFRRSGPQNQPGEGIGLAHVRTLAYRLGGTIDLSSELGMGTVFRLSLPVTLSEPQDDSR